MLAINSYHEEFDSLPPPFTTDRAGTRLHSWRTLILPYLDRQDLYHRLRLQEPWNSPHNKEIQRRFGASARYAFECPNHPAKPGSAKSETCYVAIVGPGAAWQIDRQLSFSDIVDGAANTLGVVEVADSGINWMEPRDLYIGQMSTEINSARGQGISSYHFTENRMGYTSVSNVAMLDASVRSLSASMPDDLLEHLIMVEDGLPLEGWGGRLDRSR